MNINFAELDEWLLWNKDISQDDREMIMDTLTKYEEKQRENGN